MTLKEKYSFALNWWEETNPDATSELIFNNNFELLVAVMLSAQCTDARVNTVTPALFKAYPNAEKMSKATEDDLLDFIKSVSYPNMKAKHLLSTAKMLTDLYKGEVPCTMEELTKLPGVGRKTASVILICAFNIPAMPVDTHVFRVSNRIGLTKSTTPEKTEKDLLKYIPSEKTNKAHHWILLHGRYICTSRNPQCVICGLKEICDYYKKKIIRL